MVDLSTTFSFRRFFVAAVLPFGETGAASIRAADFRGPWSTCQPLFFRPVSLSLRALLAKWEAVSSCSAQPASRREVGFYPPTLGLPRKIASGDRRRRKLPQILENSRVISFVVAALPSFAPPASTRFAFAKSPDSLAIALKHQLCGISGAELGRDLQKASGAERRFSPASPSRDRANGAISGRRGRPLSSPRACRFRCWFEAPSKGGATQTGNRRGGARPDDELATRIARVKRVLHPEGGR